MHPYTDRFVDPAAVDAYEADVYGGATLDSHLDGLERQWLRAQVRERFPDRPPLHLDFACGTGRILLWLQNMVAAGFGYDTSQAMLDRAREKGVRAGLEVVATEGPLPTPPATDGPVVVTIFRLMLNADPQTRHRALEFAASALAAAGDGILVVNNHGSSRSLRQLARPWRGSEMQSLSDSEMRRLLGAHGLRVTTRRGFGLIPQTAYRHRATEPVARGLNTLGARFEPMGALAIDQVYVAEAVRGA